MIHLFRTKLSAVKDVDTESVMSLRMVGRFYVPDVSVMMKMTGSEMT